MWPLIQMNIWMPSWPRQTYTPMMMQSCVVTSQHPSKGRHWIGTVDSYQGPLTTSTLLSRTSMSNMQPTSHIVWCSLLQQADGESLWKFMDRFGRVVRTSQRLHPYGKNVKVQERGQTSWIKAWQVRRKHQGRLTQVGKEAQTGQVTASPIRARVRGLHTPYSQLHYNPWGRFQLRGT